MPAAELLPGVTPVVNIKLPANPPERYERSLLYVADNATACTGRPKSRNATSFGSVNEAMHTFPSIEEEAMCIAFDGVRGTGGCFGLLDEGEVVFTFSDDFSEEALCSDVIRPTASPLAVGNGGGNGDTDKVDIEAEWARYTRIDLSDGRARTCYLGHEFCVLSGRITTTHDVSIVSSNNLSTLAILVI